MRPVLKYDIPLDAFSGQWIFWADVDGDGRCEAILHEHAACLASHGFAIDSKRFPGWTTPADQAQFCVTVCNLDGKKLWQIGDPWTGTVPYRSHGGTDFGFIHDLDGDGRLEHVFIFKDQLWILDARTGAVKQRQAIGWDGFFTLGYACFEGRNRPPQIWMNPNEIAPPGHADYMPLRVYRQNGDRYWPDRDIPRVGHMPVAYDIDRDGKDELFAGACLLDNDGTTLWTMDIPSHVDQCYISDVNEDGREELVMALCGGGNGVVADAASGTILWQATRQHCAAASVGKFRNDLPGLQIVFDEDGRVKDPDAITTMYDCQGQPLWKMEGFDKCTSAIVPWPTECGQAALIAFASPMPDQGSLLVDGLGRRLFNFPIECNFAHLRKRIGPRSRLEDWGEMYSLAVKDVDGDGIAEVILATRERIRVFGYA